jgi:SAM-dependent methyltransferase
MHTDYWDIRWRQAASKYEASWKGDPHMRMLELDLIYRWLLTKLSTPKILEIGCGPYTLDEYPPLAAHLRDRARYMGIDNSTSAIEIAQSSAPEDFRFRVLPATTICAPTEELKDFSPNMIICRRVLQNMEKEDRIDVIRSLCLFQHGIVLECTEDGLARCNYSRKHFNLEPIRSPQFNDYLSNSEAIAIESTIMEPRAFPFSHYYLRTRAQVPMRTIGGDICAFWEQVLGGRYDTPSMGPLTVWSW